MGKAHERESPASSKQATNVLDLIHTDLCEMLTLSRSYNKWIITFIDDTSGFAALHFLQSKADAVRCFQDLITFIDDTSGFAALHFLQSKADAVRCFQDLVSWAEAQTGYRL